MKKNVTLYLMFLLLATFSASAESVSVCASGQLTLTINFDNKPADVGWEIKNGNSTVFAYSYVGSYAGQSGGGTIVESIPTLSDGDYVLVMIDASGDGLCCGSGNGSYTLSDGYGPIISGSTYGFSDVTQFCMNQTNGDVIDTQAPTAPVLSVTNITSTSADVTWLASTDNVGVTDYGIFSSGVYVGNTSTLGGTLPGLTPNTTYTFFVASRDLIGNFSVPSNTVTFTTSSGGSVTTTIIHQGFFESGWDGWIDGGNDCVRYSGNKSYEGSYSIQLRDNSGVSSSMTSQAFNLITYDSVEVSFKYYAQSMESGEDFFLQFYQNGSWVTVEDYVSGVDFNGNGFNSANVMLRSTTNAFGTNSKFRFQCDASGNNDKIYIDAVIFTAYGYNSNLMAPAIHPGELVEFFQKEDRSHLESISTATEEIEKIDELIFYPNPVSDKLSLSSVTMDEVKSISIFSSNGRQVLSEQRTVEMNVSHLDSGIYFIRVQYSNGSVQTKSFIKN